MGDTARRLLAAFFALALLFTALPGTSWTTNTDPDLVAGDYALVQVAHGAASAVAAKATAAGATDVATLDTIDVVTARLSADAVRALRSDPRVAVIASDAPVTSLSEGDCYETGHVTPSPGLAAINAQRALRTATGRNVTVAVMDTGIADHPALKDSVVARVDFVNDGATMLDPGGHGTFVAGLIAAHHGRVRGVAPEAKLVSLRVLDSHGHGTMHSVLAAFDWLLKNRTAFHIRVLNLSFGAPQTTTYHRELLAGVVESAWFAGIAVVAAAGNGGPAPFAVAMPGADPFVLTVGSFADQGTRALDDDRESVFSSRGPTKDGFTKPDILAPGEHVVSLRVPGSSMDVSGARTPDGTAPQSTEFVGEDNQSEEREGDEPDREDGDASRAAGYARLSGTSASTAYAAGAAALLVEAHPGYTPTQIKGAIVAGGRRIAGTPTTGLDVGAALSAQPALVNAGVAPSNVLLVLLAKTGQAIEMGVSWEGITWEAVSWEAVSWEAVSWEAVSWEAVTWDSVTWELR